MLITLKGIIKSFGDEEVLKNINMTIDDKGRYGLIGVNGAGKTTLLKTILGELPYDGGEMVKKPGLSLGYLAQNSSFERDFSIIDEMRTVFSDVFEAEKSMRELEEKMASMIDHDSLEYRQISAQYVKCQAYFDSRDGYNVDVKIKTILNGMGFGDRSMDTVISTLSGGEKTRLALAKLLLEEPELLVLDEPTNHLDFKTLKWLEEYLMSYNGAILVVSHDRYFLDKTVECIYEIERGKLYTYKGNYSKYLVEKEERQKRLKKEYELQQVEIAHMKEYIEKNMARASTSASAKSRLKALEAMDIIESPEGALKTMKLRFDYLKEPYKDVLTVKNMDVSVGEPPLALCEDVNFEVKRGEKVAIIGANGIGKSTFLKTIQGFLKNQNGGFEWGKNVKIGYYEQENLNLSPEKIALDELWDRFPHIPETEIRKALENVLLTKEDVFKPVKVISGGERAKLAFCIIMLEKANVLILDEPTNHLDLASKEILEKALNDFGGTVLFVSHDRYFLNKVPDKIIEFTKSGVKEYRGNYEDYCEAQERIERELKEEEQKIKEKAPNKEKAPSLDGGFRSKEQRRQDALRKTRIKELERLIEEAEEKLGKIEEEMTKEEVFSDYQLMRERCEEADLLRKQLEEYFEEWTLLEE